MINQAAHQPEVINRREFLYYLLGASLTVFAAGSCAGLAWMASPHPAPRSTEGLFTFSPSEIPPSDAVMPTFLYEGNIGFALSNSDQGLIALNLKCPFFGVWLKWSLQGMFWHSFPSFMCLACSSQFTKDGIRVQGIASRNMDSYAVEITTPNGITRTPKTGGPVSIQGATQIVIDTQTRILGKPRSGGSLTDQDNLARHTFGD